MSLSPVTSLLSRRNWLRAATAGTLSCIGPALFAAPSKPNKARIAITLDLEMSAVSETRTDRMELRERQPR